ncbi:MAG: single-stranded-DNA-specific exonuclease RecJ [Neisseriaceae bacterium]|nr:single-stranded-DNA-specific exonuclease RecJ [Neisseriaceae bacterium]
MSNISIRPVNQLAYQNLIENGFDELSARLLASRGVNNSFDADNRLANLIHFNQLKNIAEVASRLSLAINNREHIMVIADYDADGATACALAVRGLRAMGAVVDYIVPNRFTNGYGITPSLVDEAYSCNANLLLTVDNGIAAVEAVNYANSLGLEVIVTDHHLPADSLPNCLIVNPNQPECPFPCKSLAGVGVMFYVLIALRDKLRKEDYFNKHSLPEINLSEYLDLVALGTVADVVRLEHNNRILVSQGLSRIRKGKMCCGIRALFQISRRDYQRARTYDLGFFIGPRINAAGRIDDMEIGIRCLLSDNENEAYELAEQLNKLNQERRSIEKNMIDNALIMPEIQLSDEKYTISVLGEDWHEGVIGIVAGRLREKFYRPTIVFARSENGQLKGSGRSIEQLNLRDAIDLVYKQRPDLIVRFGGHAMAAGLTLHQDAFFDFQQTFEEVVSKMLCQEDLIKEYRTDGSLNNSELTLDRARQLSQQVWGQGFIEPVFCDEFYVLNQKIVGSEHLKLVLQKENNTFEAMIFRCNETLPEYIRIVYRPVANLWKGGEELQLYIDYWESAGK